MEDGVDEAEVDMMAGTIAILDVHGLYNVYVYLYIKTVSLPIEAFLFPYFARIPLSLVTLGSERCDLSASAVSANHQRLRLSEENFCR